MRRLLLDTHVFLWWLASSSKLGASAAKLMDDRANVVFVSAVTGWEIAIKRALGKLRAPNGLNDIVIEEGFVHLPVTFQHGECAGELPPRHLDPFDRMLIAQAQIEGLELVSADSRLARYGVKLLAANV